VDRNHLQIKEIGNKGFEKKRKEKNVV